MAVKIRMKRMGRTHLNFFRVNAVDSRSPRDGRVIEELGHYDPQNKDATKQFLVKADRCKYWLDQGAIPSETVSSLLKKAGFEHKGLVFRKYVIAKPKAVVEEKKEAAGA